MQSVVYKKTAPALAGQMMLGSQDDFGAVSHIAASALTVGNFAFVDSTDAAKINTAGTIVAGIVPRVITGGRAGFAAIDTIPAGEHVCLFLQGAIAVKNATATTVTVGMNAFAKQSDGSVGFASADTLADHTATGYKVVKVFDGGVQNSMVIIDNRQPA